jgi:NCS1 family nucleobase:cation symporter-1
MLAVFVLPNMHMQYATAPLAAKTPFSSWLLALLVVAAGALSYANYGADYSRYLHKSTHSRSVVLWTTLGCFIPLVLLNFVGLAAATATNMTNEMVGIQRLVPTWFGTLYLAIIVGGAITNNFINTYSSGLSLLATGIKVSRTTCIALDAVVGGGMAVYAVFVYNFTSSFIQLLSLMVVWLAPWCGIYLTDMLMRRARYDVPGLFAPEGPYWYSKGWNWRAIGVFALGIAGALLFANAPLYRGPLTGLTGDGDISIYVGFLLSAMSYYWFMQGTIRLEVPAEES